MWLSRPFTFDRVVRIFFTIVICCIILYFLYVLRRVLLPFSVACLIAYILEPCVKWNQKYIHIKNHAWAALVTTFEGLLLFLILCFILIPIVEKEFAQLSLILDNYMKTEHYEFYKIPIAWHHFIHSHFDLDSIINEIDKVNVTQAIEVVWTDLTSGLDKILGVLGWLVTIVYVLFILMDFDKYKRSFQNLIPQKYKGPISEVSHDVSWSMKRYFRNQALISVITGILYIIGFSIVGIPMAVVIGLMNMVLFMVPYLVYVSVIPVIAMCIFKSMETGVDFWLLLLECAAVYAVVEMISDLVLTPKIMGKALGLNPAMILLSLSIWGTLLGLFGMIIALPATTIILKWCKIGLTNWRNNVDSA